VAGKVLQTLYIFEIKKGNFKRILMFYFLVKMQRHDKVGIVDFSDDEFKDDIDVSYCPQCKEYGSKKN